MFDFKPLLAENAMEALPLVSATSPDIMLMDQRMPDMMGTQLAQMLRRDPRFVNTPMLLYTAGYHGSDQHDEFLMMGLDAVVYKPFPLKEMKGILQRALELPSNQPFSSGSALLLHASHQNRDDLRQLCAALASRIQTPLIALPSRLDAVPGYDRNKSLVDALRASRTLTLCASPEMLDYGFVRRAIDYFTDHRKPMTAILLEDCELPDAFDTCHVFGIDELELYVDWLRRYHGTQPL
jgi:CheY-like chemotaxis protein